MKGECICGNPTNGSRLCKECLDEVKGQRPPELDEELLEDDEF